MSTASAPSSMPCLTASNATLAGSAPSAPRTTVAPARSPQVASWSAAAARNVSAAPSTTWRPLGDQHPGELADGGGLAGAVDADDSSTAGRPSCGSARIERSRSVRRASVRTSRSSGAGLLGGAHAAAGELGAQGVDQLDGHLGAEVGLQEHRPRRPPRSPRPARRRRAGRAGPARIRCGSGPAARAAAPAGPRSGRCPRHRWSTGPGWGRSRAGWPGA